MKFSAAATLFAAGLATASTTAKVTDLSIRDNAGLQSVSFKVDGTTDCSSSDPSTLAGNGANACGDGNPPVYTFSVEKNGASDYQLWLHKNVDGSVRGLNGGGKAPVYCHAGGNGQDDFVCSQVGDLEVELQ
ncbi:putative hypersensitive response-inducing protein elicitor [Diplodia seriata]|uniref:Putative hypersensitive response-inducing protein elicitor n=1 Tax=Diplodia seriata TaxID=420778 RepID=A0A0G2G7X1_9PEZI|nr:putative hypersensitive response-inducing protein elicitor [Diplodia seriata]